jgi:hypothetical protein
LRFPCPSAPHLPGQSGRIAARMALGGEFPPLALSMARGVPSSPLAHVSARPPLLPDGRISRVRLGQQSPLPKEPSHPSRGLNARPSAPLAGLVLPLARRPEWAYPVVRALRPDGGAPLPPATYRAPLCPSRALPASGGCRAPSQRAFPLRRRSYGLLRPTLPPLAAWGSLEPRVFAGCDESLLAQGGSRRYLCGSVPRGLAPYPGGVAGACPPYFPPPIGLPPVPRGRLTATRRSATSERG